LTVLVIAPHPDDEVLGCGGALARHVSHGDFVVVAILTNGAMGAPHLYSSEDVLQIRTEALTAHKMLGVHRTIFEDLPATRLDSLSISQVAESIGTIISSVEPKIVYMPHHGDRHRDHWVVNQAAQVACRPRSGCSVKRILAYETASETEWGDPNPSSAFVPNWFIDITAELPVKITALQSYKSQLKPLPDPRSIEAITALARWRGASSGFHAAEAFMLLRERYE
jgi:N-acetylglucosamine malate deacetylase 1